MQVVPASTEPVKTKLTVMSVLVNLGTRALPVTLVRYIYIFYMNFFVYFILSKTNP